MVSVCYKFDNSVVFSLVIQSSRSVWPDLYMMRSEVILTNGQLNFCSARMVHKVAPGSEGSIGNAFVGYGRKLRYPFVCMCSVCGTEEVNISRL